MNTISAIQPKRPQGNNWTRFDLPFQFDNNGYPVEGWMLEGQGITALSAVEVAHDPDQPDVGPEYHLSISRNGGRIDSQGAAWVLRQFGLEDATEDNHVPHGVARNFWRPVADNLSGIECGCKDEEPAMVEDKGDYIWRGTKS